jgi:1-acyl-sn-glycerol-3-phosphate acyltransferase
MVFPCLSCLADSPTHPHRVFLALLLFLMTVETIRRQSNYCTKLFFRQCGFIPVQMAANKAGDANDYDMKSFKNLLKVTKQAFEEGFEIAILPEGQLNPHPERGLLPCFPGALPLARMSKRTIQK